MGNWAANVFASAIETMNSNKQSPNGNSSEKVIAYLKSISE